MPRPKALLAVPAGVFRTTLAEQLCDEGGTEIVTADDAAAARALAADSVFAFAIIDQTIHQEDGHEDGAALARSLYEEGFAAPILVLGDVPEEEGFAALAKPFRVTALMQKLGQLLAHPEDTALRIGPYAFHPSAKLLVADGRKIRLTEKETDILRYLKAATGIVPRQTLLGEVWGYGPAVATHTLETHIYRLRRKIEHDPGDARILLTEDGGYRLCA